MAARIVDSRPGGPRIPRYPRGLTFLGGRTSCCGWGGELWTTPLAPGIPDCLVLSRPGHAVTITGDPRGAHLAVVDHVPPVLPALPQVLLADAAARPKNTANHANDRARSRTHLRRCGATVLGPRRCFCG